MNSRLLPKEYIVDVADEIIKAALCNEVASSFFLQAGAGAGKTQALKHALDNLLLAKGAFLRQRGQRVAVITYTNPARDEIERRIQFNPAVFVSTIHSFLWEMLRGFDLDMKNWLDASLIEDIANLEVQQARGRKSKASEQRGKDIVSKIARRERLQAVRRFVYNPSAQARGVGALGHADVLKMGTDFIMRKPLMQEVLACRFPYLLIDEGQDTNKGLIDALLVVQRLYEGRFILGVFGDTMQRVYLDGQKDLDSVIPPHWPRPRKVINRRSAKRIVQLVNSIRAPADDYSQDPLESAATGLVRFFACSSSGSKLEREDAVRRKMAEISGDKSWNNSEEVKTLILEHHMAARRMGFSPMFEALYRLDRFRTGMLEGTLSHVTFFMDLVLPLVQALHAGDRFRAAALMRKNSPLLREATLKAAGFNQLDALKKARVEADILSELCKKKDVTFWDVLNHIALCDLFDVPDSLASFVNSISPSDMDDENAQDAIDQADDDVIYEAISEYLSSSFWQIEGFNNYINGLAHLDTQQGVKGLEFARVVVVVDDAEARGFLFSYDKLFGTKDPSRDDLEKERNGDDTGIARTRRLFYVGCSRAREGLAVVAYSDDPTLLRAKIINAGWFGEDETELCL